MFTPPKKTLATLLVLAVASLAFLAISAEAQANSTVVYCNATQAPPTPAPGDPKMTWEAWVTVAIVAGVLFVLMLDLVGCTAAMVFSSVLFWLTTVISLDDMFLGMTNSGVLAIVTMFIIVHPVADLPMMQALVRKSLSGSDWSPKWPLFKLCLLSMVLSSFCENIPQVAVFTPVISELCRELGLPVSQFLMPMNYATLIGNWLVIGSGSNLLISGLMEDYGLGAMSFFELGKVGWLSFIPAMIYLVFAPAFLLSNKTSSGMMSKVKSDGHDFLMQIRVRKGSPLIGLESFVLAEHFPGIDNGTIQVVELISNGMTMKPSGAEVLERGDVIVLSGAVGTIISNFETLGLEYYFESDLQMRPAKSPEEEAAAAGPAAVTVPEEVLSSPATTPDAGATDAEETENAAAVPKDEDKQDEEMKETENPETKPAPAADPFETSANKKSKDTQFGKHSDYGKQSDTQFGKQSAVSFVNDDAFIPIPARRNSFSRKNPTFMEESRLFEVVLSGDCPVVDEILKSGRFQYRYSATIMALRTSVGAHDLTGSEMMDHVLVTGDTLLILAPKSFAEEWRPQFDFLVINEFKNDKDRILKDYYFTLPGCFPCGQQVQGKEGAKRILRIPGWYRYLSLVAFLGVVVAAILHVKLHAAGLLASCALIMFGIIDTKTAISYIDWNTYLMVAFSFGMGKAVYKSGLAAVIGFWIVESGINGFALLLLIGCLTTLLANIVTNKAAAQVMFPIVYEVYVTLGKDPLPGIMVLTSTTVFALSTPYGIPTNVLVMGPGNYHPKDYLKFGVPLNIMLAIIIPFTAAWMYGDW